MLNLHFAIKVSAAEVLTELLIIKSVPDIPWYSDGAEHLEKGDDGFLQRAGKELEVEVQVTPDCQSMAVLGITE